MCPGGQTPVKQKNVDVNRRAVKTAVESLTYSRGFGKNEADVFRYVTNSMFTSSAGDRQNVPNIVSSADCLY